MSDSGAAKTLTSGGADSLLARYAFKYVDRPLLDWPQPLRLADVRNDLGGEPREELRRLIRDPASAVARWGSDQPVVLERLREQFGIDLSANQSTA